MNFSYLIKGTRLILLIVFAVAIKHSQANPVELLRIKTTDNNCAFEYRPINLFIDIKKITNGTDFVQVPYFEVNGKNVSMLIGFCKGITTKTCQGKSNKGTAACLLTEQTANNTTLTAKNSKIVGSISKSILRLKDNRLLCEIGSYNNNSLDTSKTSNATAKAKLESTRVEFYCSEVTKQHPEFIRYENSTYVFQWGWKEMCLEALKPTAKPKKVIVKEDAHQSPTKAASAISPSSPSDQDLHINLDSKSKTAEELHEETSEQVEKIINKPDSPSSSSQKPSSSTTTTVPPSVITKPSEEKDGVKANNQEPKKQQDKISTKAPSQSASSTATNNVSALNLKPSESNGPKMNRLHKFFMISLIVVSLAGFVIVIFILDKKTRLRIPLSNLRRQARQVLQPQPVPYTRVDRFNDHLDL